MDIMFEGNIKYLTDFDGFRQDVVIPYNIWETILEKLNLKLDKNVPPNILLKNEYDKFFSDKKLLREQIEMTRWFENHSCEAGQEW